MRLRILTLLLSLFVNEYGHAQTKVKLASSFSKPVSEKLKHFYAPSEGELKELLKGEVISVGKVHTPAKNKQQMMLFSSGIHPRNCTRAMRKLSLYENYDEYMNFIKESKYQEETQKLSFVVDHVLMPFPMTVEFKIPRITKAGHYPFTFEKGFLKDLQGIIIVEEVGKFCLLGLKADWIGTETKIPNMVFSTFIQTLGKMGMEHLIRISLF